MAASDLEALADRMEDWAPTVAQFVKNPDGRKYHPVLRNLPFLEYVNNGTSKNRRDPDKMLAEMLVILNLKAEVWDNPNSGSEGWNKIVEQAGPMLTWEWWAVMDRTAPWAKRFTEEHRWKVAVATAHTIKRGI